ncbi:MAG: hypothetical protein JNM41_05075 [Flavipsychrobacter sp.]|nr:hypothetical protein [Flavipsychrobacter sp.]
MYEKKSQPIATRAVFVSRVIRSLVVASVILLVCLAIGVVGYHYCAHIPWIDSIHNASMILSGMGPVVEITNVGGKLFSSAYAIFSGVAFITNIGIILAPAAHRLFHRLHIDDTDENEPGK